MQCLDRMLEECVNTEGAPICPNGLCRQPYSVDSVIALKALFPQRAEYFSNFALEKQRYDVIKDDTIRMIEISPDFTVSSRRMEVKCELDNTEDNPLMFLFDNTGTVADFIRELRLTLRILPLDK
ncbi:unnamed protein product, partial [Gongylonema pulchrum]|uniref:SP-RING-type domain-containing protein n=1 Tax=Gongylonema pulchrum TaxID=637853 RepID=A0A183EVK0_9BILA